MSVTRVAESRVIDAPIDIVWKHVRSAELSFWSAIKSAKVEQGSAGEDGSVQQVKIVELSDLGHFLSFDFIQSEPAVGYMSALHTIHLRKVTHNNTTFVEWSAEFSSDAKLDVIEDSKFKRLEGLEDLAKACAKK
ncbi:hypothetical protein BGW42_006566 [Actinomortierella wolfii]|nr:hypothetical protein BGW41_001644 [Actinomortierella wolfii]KAG0234485.1 hypothetical protein BGW42_006566 [Actinomortierella wolfii]